MNLINLGSEDNQISFKVDSFQDGVANIRMSLPLTAFRGFQMALHGLSDLMRYMEQKTIHYQQAERHHDPSVIAEREKYKKNFSSLICKTFDSFISGGLTPSQSITETNKLLKKKGYDNISYFIVEKLCRESGRLRKKK